jgi:CubicO group peptidase (beta-lactamase class C family)
MKFPPAVWLLLSLALLSPGRGQDVAKLDQAVQSYATRGRFMGSVLVARGDQVLLSKGYGSANLEWNIPNAPSTKFRLGSVTKQFTAASILLLEERGQLKVDDLVKIYLPDAPAAWDKITIYHLLTHTSGIPSFTGFPDYRASEPFPTTPEKLVARFRDKPLEFEPGTKWNYSNSGYILLGYLVERVSGEKYAEFVQKNIFRPLGMKDSGYDSNPEVISHRAAGYVRGPKGPLNAGYIDMTVPFSAGALYSTTEDLWRWERGLFGGKVLSSASLKKMTTPFRSNYAFGLMVETKDGQRLVSHGGGIEGFTTYLGYYPDQQVAVIVLGNLNSEAPATLGALLGTAALGRQVVLPSEHTAVAVGPEVLQRYVGTYVGPGGRKNFITLQGDQLMTRVLGQPTFPVFPESETKFFLKVVEAEIEFIQDQQGKTTALVIRQNGRETGWGRESSTVDGPAERKTVEVPLEILQQYVGTYQATPEFELTVTLEGTQLSVQATHQGKHPVFAASPTRFFLKVVDAEIEFTRDAQGKVTQLILHQNGRDLPAQRE